MKPADPRAGKLSALEARLLAAAVGERLFKRPAEPVELGRYRLLERIGQGGMGVVFRAHDPQLRRDVAVKLLHGTRGGSLPEQHARLRREALALARLSHPNVVQVFEVGEADEHLFVAMELVRGVTLRAWLGERPRGLAEVVDMVLQVGRGLAAAHAAGVVHRDLKPENVLVGADGRARVVDFGLARAAPGLAGAVSGSLERPLTRSGVLLGTPAFMAPEQVGDPSRADARSDQFSFCVLAHEALYGERPFVDREGGEGPAIRAAPAGSPVPATLRAALLRGLEADPSRRWGSMDALLVAISGARDEPAPVRRRGLWIAGAMTVVVMVVLAALVGPAWQARQRAAADERRLAEVSLRLAGMLDDEAAAARALAGLAGPGAETRLAAAGWARWAQLRAAAGLAARAAWAHAYVLGGGEEALLGLARDEREAPARVLALLAAEAPGLAEAPEVAALQKRAEADTREVDAELHARRLGDAGAPHEVVALARAGLPDLAAATLLTLAEHAAAPTRRAWQLAVAPIVGGEPGLALLDSAAAEPSLQDLARAQQVELLLADGRVAEAAAIVATRVASEAVSERGAAEALQRRLAAILAARSELSLRFTGAATSPWTELEPAALRGDPGRRTLVVDASPGERTLVAWSLTQAADRVIVDVTVAPLCMGPGARLRVRAVGGGEAVLGLQVGAHGLELGCGDESITLGPLGRAGEHPPLALQLDLDVAAATLRCRVLDERGRPRLRSSGALAGAWPPGPLRLELRGEAGSDPSCARVELREVAVTGARPRPVQPSALAQAGAWLVDGDAHAAAAGLAGLVQPRAWLWQAVALARLGRWRDGAPLLQRALAADASLDEELSAWLRGDPRVLGPALREMLGEGGYLELLLRTWPASQAMLSPALVQVLLEETVGLVEVCAGPACASLLRARGRALLQIGEREAARRALEAALAVAPRDPSGHTLASEILVDLTLLRTSPAGGESD